MKKVIILLLCLVVFIALLSLLLSLAINKVPIGAKKVALIRVEGIILDSRNVIREIKKYSKDSSVKAVVLRVDSPGGGVAPSQEIFDEIVKLKEEKKVVVSMGSVAASGGYYISSPADSIVANAGTITGSIGVIMELPNVEGLMEKIGIKTQIIKSGKHKDLASAFKTMTEEEKKILQKLLDDVHDQFIRAVSESRDIDYESIKKLADGRIFTGKKAQELGLVDELGNLEYAIELAGKLSGIEGEPEVIYKKERFSFWDMIFDRTFPKELFKDSLQTIALKYMFVP
jgi:protease-4